MDYTKLQNGSDIRGVAMEGIEGQHVNLTEQACRDIGRGFALWLRARLGKDTLRVAVGRDSRLSGPQLALWLMEAMAAEGLQVTDLGMASTPAMFMSTVTEGFAFDASVMITASHLPFNRNGYKFFTKDGGLEIADKVHLQLQLTDPDLKSRDRVVKKTEKDSYGNYPGQNGRMRGYLPWRKNSPETASCTDRPEEPTAVISE